MDLALIPGSTWRIEMKKAFWILIMITLAACNVPGQATPTTADLPYASLTPLVAAAQPALELQAEIDGLNANLNGLETEIANLESQLAQKDAEIAGYQAEGTRMVTTPTATIRPTSNATSTPTNLVTVVALGKLNLRTYTKTNNAGRPIMVIYEPRVQYQEGETFQVIKAAIQTDGGDLYYLVVGPRGAGLYVRVKDIKLAD
ncbi:MAG: hypothetical protein N2D54_09610 [Chloroflexota bacterium]